MISLDVACGLAAMVSFGLANLCSQPAAREIGSMRALLWRNVVMVVLIGPAWLVLGDPNRLSGGAVLHAAATALVGYVPIYCFYRGIQVGKLGVVAPIANAYVLVTVLVGTLIMDEPFSARAALGVAGAVLGLGIMTVNPSDWRTSELFRLQSGAPYALVTMVGWGLFFPLSQAPGRQLGGVTNSLVVEATFTLIAFGHIRLLGDTAERPQGKNWWRVLGSGAFSAVASVSLLTGIELGHVTAVAPIAAASPVVAVIGAALLFAERLRRLQYVGAVLALASIVWLATNAGGPA